MGAAFTQDTELQTEVEVNGTPFVNGDAHGLEFDTAPVFGAKIGHFIDRSFLGGQFGAEFDIYHFRPDVSEQQVRFTGLLAGVPGDTVTRIPAADTAVTALTVNLLYRFALATDATYPRGRIQPYVGVGAGAFIGRLETTTTPFDMLVRNGTSRYQLVIEALRRVAGHSSASASIIERYTEKLREHQRYIEREGVDPPEITNWMWSSGA